MNDVHTYLFHTSILFVNQQVYHEASNVFYLENLFIRVNSVTTGPFFRIPAFAAHGDYSHWLPLPISFYSSKVKACTRHVMEIDMLPCSSSVSRNLQFILAADELPLLCKRLLRTDTLYKGRIGMLQRMELWIIVGDEVLNTPTYEESAECLNAATKNASASRGEGPAKILRRAVVGSAYTGEETIWNGIATGSETAREKIELSGPPSLINTPRLRRLLEPLRALHSIGSSYIDAPISERYREVILKSLFRARPGSQDLFPILVSAYEEAMTTFRAGYFTLAVQQVRGTLDIWNESIYLCTPNSSTKLATGPFAGFMLQRALGIIRYDLYKALARAYLADCADVQRVGAAKTLARRITASYSRNDQWGLDPHEQAMAHSLLDETRQALDQLRVHKDRPRSEAPRAVYPAFTKALQTYTTSQQDLKRTQKRKAVAETLEGSEGDEKAEGKVQKGERTAPIR